MKRVIIGVRGSDYGLWISKPGADAGSTDDNDFLVSPQRNLLQPFMQGVITASNGQRVSMVVTHNLGYIPIVEVFGTEQNQSIPTTVTTNNITIGGYSTSNGYAFTCFYVIFKRMLAASG